MQHHKWALAEMDNLIPWEKEIYIEQLKKYLDEEQD